MPHSILVLRQDDENIGSQINADLWTVCAPWDTVVLCSQGKLQGITEKVELC